MTLTMSRVLGSQPGALAEAADRVAQSAAAAEAGIAAGRAEFAALADSWSGTAATAAEARGARMLAEQQGYLMQLLAMQRVLVSGSAALGDLRTRLAALVTGDLALFWIIGDDGSVAPGPLLLEYAAFSPVTELQVMLMGLELEREIRQLLAEFEMADTRTADGLRSLVDRTRPRSDTGQPVDVGPHPHHDSPDAAVDPNPLPDPHAEVRPLETVPGLAPSSTVPDSAPSSTVPDPAPKNTVPDSAPKNTVPGPHAGDPRYQTGQTPTMAGSPADRKPMHVGPGSSDQVRLQDNPPGYSGPAGPSRDAAWQSYLAQQRAANPGAVTSKTVLPNPDAVSDPGLKTVGAAAKQQGVSYAWGGGHVPGTPGVSRGWRNSHSDDSWSFDDQNRTGFDCSGLARFAAAQGYGFDISAGNIGNTVGQEAALTAAGGRGTRIPDSALKPGDLIYYGPAGASHHVVVYAGNGLVVQAQGSGQPVEISPAELGEQHRNIRLAQ